MNSKCSICCYDQYHCCQHCCYSRQICSIKDMGRKTYMAWMVNSVPLFKSVMEKHLFSVPLLMTWCDQFSLSCSGMHTCFQKKFWGDAPRLFISAQFSLNIHRFAPIFLKKNSGDNGDMLDHRKLRRAKFHSLDPFPIP